MDTKKCPNAALEVRREAAAILMEKGKMPMISGMADSVLGTSESGSSGTDVEAVAWKKRKAGSTLDNYVDKAMTTGQQAEANIKFFRSVFKFVLLGIFLIVQHIRYLVHANVAFRSAEDPFLLEFLDHIRPSYNPPSRYVLSHTVMDAESARAHTEDITRLKSWKRLTMLFDGWEDKLR